MAGIEEAFEKFVTRVSGRERSKAEESLSKYKSYSEEELLGNIEAKRPNQLQSFSLEDYQLNTMPMIEPRDVAPPRSYSPMPNIYNTPRQYQLDLANGGVASMFRERPGYQEGGEVRRYESKEYNPITGEFVRVIREGSNYLGSGQSDPIVSIFDKEKGFVDIDVPTVDPFSGQPISAQDQLAFTQPQQDIFPTTLDGRPIEWKLINPEIGSSAGYYNVFTDVGIPSVASAQKTLQNFLGNLYSGPEIANMQEQTFGSSNLPGQTGVVSDLRHATAASQVRDKIADAVSMGYFNPAGLIPQSLGLFGSQILGAANEIQSIRPNMQSLRDIGEDLIANFYGATQVPYGQSASTTYNQLLNNPSLPSAAAYQRRVNVGSADPGVQALGRSIGNLDFSTINTLRNNADLLNAITGQTANMANGGLTKTVPPAMGPDSQGVESLFTRRYN